MTYLNFDVLNKIDVVKYQNNKPYPYISFAGALYDDAYARLLSCLPDVALFEKQFGIERRHGQKYHDKYYLLYSDSVPVAPAWKEFLDELQSDEYRRFLEKMFNVKRNDYNIALSWHYMPQGTCITPHCDTRTKIGSQLFYFNTSDTWKEEWGGQTLALDDKGERDPFTGPQLSEFTDIYTSKSVDNNSFIFTRTDHSWHAVDTIQCPETEIRKMFSVVLNRKPTNFSKIKRMIKKYIFLPFKKS